MRLWPIFRSLFAKINDQNQLILNSLNKVQTELASTGNSTELEHIIATLYGSQCENLPILAEFGRSITIGFVSSAPFLQ